MSSPAPKTRRVALLSFVVLLAITLAGRMWTNKPDAVAPSPTRSEVLQSSPIATKSESFSAEHSARQPAITKKTREQTLAPADPPKSTAVAALFQKLGKGDGRLSQAAVVEILKRPEGKRADLDAGGLKLAGVIDSRVDNGGVIHMGVALDDNLGRLVMSLREDGRMLANVMFNGESNALKVSGLPSNGSWSIESTTVSDIACRPAGTTYPFVEAEAGLLANKQATPARTGPVGAPPILSSKPDSQYVLYMDFDGEKVTSPSWNKGKLIDALPDPRADDVAYVTAVWKRTAEDYMAFDLNVTTDRAVFDAAAISNRVMCVCTPTNTAAPGAGGVAYLFSFGQDIPCWNFNIGLEYASADTVSHEVGHTCGLYHDGTTTGAEYFGGLGGTGPHSWSPIMGAAWANANYEEVTQFSKGEYPDANNKEDDLTIITTSNGFGFREDDKGSSLDNSSPLAFDDTGVADKGIIERNTDEDWFNFSTSGGDINLKVLVLDVDSSESPQRGANLAASADLYDSTGKLVASSNEENSLDASIAYYANAGVYYLKVKGVGKGTLATGFSDYDSLGQYSITGTVPQQDLLKINPDSATLSSHGGTAQFKVTSKNAWTWKSSEPWVTSSEAVSQIGSQIFEYSVASNSTTGPRSATITLNAGGFQVIHTINQEAPGTDDHGNTIGTATLVDQVSVTPGTFEIEGDTDVFRIDVKGYGNLSVKSIGTTDTFGQLLDFQGTLIASNDNALNPNFRITRPVSTGTYYVRVRHAIKGGTGSYQVASSFTPTEALTITVAKRTIGPEGASAGFDVVSNVDWSWSTDVPWIQSAEPVSQSKGQTFEYSVLPNTTNLKRTGHIILVAGPTTVVHTVIQTGITTDDYGNTISKAASFVTAGSIDGTIDYEGDADVFRIEVKGSGTLTLSTTGTLDSYGELLDAKGRILSFNDDFGSANFRLSSQVNAGTYYVKVRHFTNSGLGKYRLNSTFLAASTIYLRYTVGVGGTINGFAQQGVKPGTNGTTVRAVPDAGYSFVKWSDGVRTASRTDRGVYSNVSVVASFSPSMSVRVVGGPFLIPADTTPVDFGFAALNQTKETSFYIRNNSQRPLTGLKVVKSTANGLTDWSVARLSATSLAPGTSAVLKIRMKSSVVGYKSATFLISASESFFAPFPLNTMAYVQGPIGGLAAADPSASQSSGNSPTQGSANAADTGSPSSDTKSTALDSNWVVISPDGLFHYRFQKALDDDSTPRFWISGDGATWKEATVSSIQRISKTDSSIGFEASLLPTSSKDIIAIVSETPPAASTP